VFDVGKVEATNLTLTLFYDFSPSVDFWNVYK
jgi:hypothetical protein